MERFIPALVLLMVGVMLYRYFFTHPAVVQAYTPHQSKLALLNDGQSPLSNNGKEMFGSDQLVGLMYPPRAGPLHTNYQFPKTNEKCPRAFTAIFNQEPLLREYNQHQPACN